jgi:hypothetical protein
VGKFDKVFLALSSKGHQVEKTDLDIWYQTKISYTIGFILGSLKVAGFDIMQASESATLGMASCCLVFLITGTWYMVLDQTGWYQLYFHC